MRERLFDITRKLGSVFLPENRELKLKRIEADLIKAEGLQKIQVNENWSIVQGVFDSLHSQAVTELSKRGLQAKDMERLNHRLELLKDIHNNFDRIMKSGTEALQALDKLKEKRDDGQSSN